MMSRTKGKAGEREVAGIVRDLLGFDVRRRVRQHEGDSDLDGVPGWCVEVKRHAKASRAEMDGWWAQASAQAESGSLIPVVLYRVNRGKWRAIWPLWAALTDVAFLDGLGPQWMCDTSIEAWATVVQAHLRDMRKLVFEDKA